MAPLLIEDDSSLSSRDYATPSSAHRPLHDAIAATLQCRSRSRRTRKHVSFGALVTAYEVISRDDITEEEKKASWFDADEVIAMKRNARNDAKLVETGVLADSEDFSVRGLESKTRTGARSRRYNRMNARAAVFFEIECQEQDYYYDDEGVADAYLVYSDPCQSAAEEIGMRDELAARSSMLCHDGHHDCGEKKCNGKDWSEYFRVHPLNYRAVPYEQSPSVMASSAA